MANYIRSFVNDPQSTIVETFLQYFLVILKQMLQNHKKILKKILTKCFLSTTCTVIQQHRSYKNLNIYHYAVKYRTKHLFKKCFRIFKYEEMFPVYRLWADNYDDSIYVDIPNTCMQRVNKLL